MTLKIAHLCEHAFNGGALASLRQIRLGISTQRPQWYQDVIVASKKDTSGLRNPAYFEQDAIYINYENLNKHLKSYNVVFIHKLMNSNVGRLLTFIPRAICKTVVVSHTYSVNPSNCLVGRPDLCICVSDYMHKNFKKLNPKTNFVTIHNAVSSDWIKKIVKDECIKRPGIIGRANALNNIKYSKKFTEWFSNKNFSKSFIMEYLGGGSILEEARSYASSVKKYNYIDFKGNIIDDQVRYKMMSSWEFFLYDINMPEGTSMAVLESVALGVPVICSNRPGNNEIIKSGINGYTFSDLNEAEKIIENLLLENNLSNLQSSCSLYSESNKDFLKMSENYVKAIENLLISTSKNIINSNSSGVQDLGRQKNNNSNNQHSSKNDFILRGNRKVSLPNNDLNVVNNKKVENNKEKQKTNSSNMQRVEVPQKLSKDKKIDKNKVKKTPSHKPLATPSFIEDIMKKIEVADKVSTGPKFSIISAGYNKGIYIDDWANSIIAQSYRPLEVVFVDDASNDITDETIKKYIDIFAERNIEFRLEKNANQKGCAKSYKNALEKATGNYFGVLDADDALMPDAVNIVMSKYLSNPKISFIWSQYIRCNSDMTMVGSGISRQVPQRPPKTILEYESHVKRTHCYSHWRTMKKIDNMYDVFDCPYSSSVDKFMGYMLEELGHGHFLNIPLYKYRGSVNDGLTATTAQRNNWEKIRSDAKRRRIRSRKKVYSIIL